MKNLRAIRRRKNPDGGSILKIGLLGVGAYFLYEYLSTPTTTTTAVTSQTAQTTTQSNAPTTGTGTTTTSASTTAVPVVSAATQLAQLQSASLQTVSQWNWYERQANPQAVIVLSAMGTGADGNQPISFAQYQSYAENPATILSAPGSNSPLAGLGTIINLQSLFQGSPLGAGFGEEEFGLGVIVDDPNNSEGYIDEGNFVTAAGFDGSNDGTVSDFLLAASGQGS